MFKDGPNPSLVQSTPPSKCENPPSPLVLIHDGGGTTFSYFTLGDLHREVWAIHDPRYWDSKPWEGGVEEIAGHYIKLMQMAGINGDILMGGKIGSLMLSTR
jgi:pimeloyl-ACP methyl ester carboxylesterase